MATVHFPQWDITLQAEGTIAQACAQAGHPLDLVCGGTGTCGKCMVDIQDAQGRRQVKACSTPVCPDMSIWCDQGQALHILETGEAQDDLSFDPVPPSLRYGVACDLGTTSVVLYLYDRQEQRLLGQWSSLNQQNALGADVVARLQSALEDGQGPVLQGYAVATIQDLLIQAQRDTEITPSQISTLVVAGNSVMEHLLWGFPLDQLAKAPYECYSEAPCTKTGTEIGLTIAPDIQVTTLPMVGSFVGGDTVAAMLATGWDNNTKPCLLIDLGTNGELVVGTAQRRMATSAAAGPAMEGAGIVHGMRGIQGAIEGMSLAQGRLELQIIGNSKPAGICGSGLVDILAQLCDQNILSSMGRMLTSEQFLGQGGAPWLAERLTLDQDGQPAFLLATAEESATGSPLYLHQSDVRAMQLSKGAITAAALLLLEAYKISGTDLAEIQLAGAFGNYIDVENAQKVGLIPDFPGVPVRSVGNAAGVGAQMYLLSQGKQDIARHLGATTDHVDLARTPSFSDVFAVSMELCPVSEMDFDD